MKVITIVNGGIKIELETENSDDKYVIEMIKEKAVTSIKVTGKGVIFSLAPKAAYVEYDPAKGIPE